MRRTERLFALAEALRARRTGVTAEDLAARFRVSVRTIYRDLDALREADLPLQGERGPGGGYALDRSYSLPPINFTAREALLLLTLGRWAAQLRVLPFGRTLASGLDKVRAALPTSSQRQLERLETNLTFVGIPALPSTDEVREAVERGFFESLPLRILYRRADLHESERKVRVESVILERAETILNCVDLELNEPRQLRLHRIIRAEVLVPERER